MAENTLRFDNLIKVLEEYGKEAETLYKAKITEGRPPYGTKNASGELLNSVRWGMRVNGRTYEVTLSLAEYWKYVEGGAQGRETSPFGAVYRAHWPPVSAIREWIDIKPVIPRPGRNGRIPTKDQLAFLISRNIARHGIEPFPALSRTVEELNAKYSERIAEAVSRDVAAFVPIMFSSFNWRDLAR
jgi:hypothetical protein